MRVYYVAHDGVWLTGYSVVVARDRGHARRLLKKMLEENGLKYEDDLEFVEVLLSPQAILLDNGDY